MRRRYAAIWFRHLKTDWLSRRKPPLLRLPFVLCLPDHGRMMITASNPIALQKGIYPGMALADARAILPGLQYFDDNSKPSGKLLKSIAMYCIRYAPLVSADYPDGVLMDCSGCSHLWGGDKSYLEHIVQRFQTIGYAVQAGMADTPGAAWAIAHFGSGDQVVLKGEQKKALIPLSPEALRLEPFSLELLMKLGLRSIGSFIDMPRSALRSRFGQTLLKRLDQVMGIEEDWITPLFPPIEFEERLPSLEPIVTATGIDIALKELLHRLCDRLKKESKGLRACKFHCFRVDGKTITLEIGTTHASNNQTHLLKLFEEKVASIEPDLGIELFTLQATRVDDVTSKQESLWEGPGQVDNIKFLELFDRIADKIGEKNIKRYLPCEHHLPERSFRLSSPLNEPASCPWMVNRPRPMQLLASPEHIEVTAPVPDYPPMLFRYKGQLHQVKKADGPERIEQEWWIEPGEHRDYFSVEDQDGRRYWLFRSGHYIAEKKDQWFVHGFFA